MQYSENENNLLRTSFLLSFSSGTILKSNCQELLFAYPAVVLVSLAADGFIINHWYTQQGNVPNYFNRSSKKQFAPINNNGTINSFVTLLS